MREFLVLVLATGCIGPPSAAVHPRHSLAGREAGAPQKCVVAMPRERLLVVDSRTLSYRFGNSVYRTRVRDECPGLNVQSTIIVDTIGDRYCDGDLIKVVEPGATMPRHICSIGPFTRYDRTR